MSDPTCRYCGAYLDDDGVCPRLKAEQERAIKFLETKLWTSIYPNDIPPLLSDDQPATDGR